MAGSDGFIKIDILPGDDKLTPALGRITGKSSEFQRSLEASNARVLAFGASAGALYTLKSAFDKLVTSTVEVESSLVSINTLLNLSQTELSKFSSNLFKAANSTSSSFADAAKAAQEFSRQGLSVEATLKRTVSALTLTKLSGLSLEDSVSSLTATLNGFGKEALTEIDIVNRLANVDAKFAVSSADLAEALKRVSSSASDAGVGFNQIISLVTAAQQVTARGGAVIGNSLKTILTRIQRPQVLEDLEAVGVIIRDLSGKKLPVIADKDSPSILRELAKSYDTLSSAQKSFVAETVGGVYQINILKSLLGDLGNGFTIYDGAVSAAEKSTASAQKRIEALNNTIASQFIRTLNNLTQASAAAGNAILGPTIRGGAKAFDNVLNAGKKFNPEKGEDENSILGSLAGAAGKGLGNILAGPGVQAAVFGLFKLFEKLIRFVKDSLKDITGLNDKLHAQEAFQAKIVEDLQKQDHLYDSLISKAGALQEITKASFDRIGLQNKEQSAISLIATAMVKTNKGKAEGHVANVNAFDVYSEMLGAKSGGYNSGSVVKTNVANGNSSFAAIVNTAETKSSIKVGGKTYDFINPPENSIAGKKHATSSLARTGVNPYRLSQMKFASGKTPKWYDLYDTKRKTAKIKYNKSNQNYLENEYPAANAAIDNIIARIPNKNPGSSGGSIPHFALGDDGGQFFASSLLGVLPFLVDNLGSVSGTAKRFGGYLSTFTTLLGNSGKVLEQKISTDKAGVEANRAFINSVARARQGLISGDITKVRIGPNIRDSFRTAEGIDKSKRIQGYLAESQQFITEHDERVSQRKTAFRTAGLVASIGGGFAGGVASNIALKGFKAPDAAAAIDDATVGIQTAGQILSVFPNQFGKFTAVIAAATGIVSGIDTFAKGIGASRKAFDVINDRTQKLASEINNLITTLSSLDGMYLDSSVTQEALVKTQRKYEESLAKLATSSEQGQELANKIQGAGTNRSKTRELVKAQEFYIKALEKQANLTQIGELGAERKFFGVGVGLFGGGTEAERNKSSQILQSSASFVLSDASESKRKQLIKTVDRPELFEQSLKGDKGFQSISKAIEDAAGFGKGGAAVNLLVSQIKLLVGQTRLNQDPRVKAARDSQIAKSEAGQEQLDNLIKKQQNLRKLFVNKGAISGSLELNKQSRESQGRFDAFEISEARAKSANKVSNLFSNDETNQARDIESQGERNKAEFARKRDEINVGTSRQILGLISPSFEDAIKGGNPRASEDGSSPFLSKPKEDLINAINKGILSTVKATSLSEGGLAGAIDKDPKAFISSIVSGISDPTLRKRAENNISANLGGDKLLEVVKSGDEEMLKAMKDFLKAQNISAEQLRGIYDEAKAKRGAESFGGLRELTDPRYAREQRILRAQAVIFSNSPNPEVRARGLVKQLEVLRNSGGTVNPNDPRFAEINAARNAAIQRGIGFTPKRGTSGEVVIGALKANFEASKNAKPAQNTFRDIIEDPEQRARSEKALNDIIGDKSVSKLATGTATRADSFPKALEDLESAIRQSATRIRIERKRQEIETRQSNRVVNRAIAQSGNQIPGPKTQADVDKGLSNSGNSLPSSGSVILTTAAALALFVANRSLSKSGRNLSKEQFDSVKDGARKATDFTKNLFKPKETFSYKPVTPTSEKPFSFSAFNQKGKAVTGQVNANTLEEAVEKVRKQGNFPVKVKSIAPAPETNIGVKQSRPLPTVPGQELKPNFFNRPEPTKPPLTPQQQEGVNTSLAKRAKSEADKIAKAEELAKRQEANITKARTQEALSGKKIPNSVLPKNFDLKKLGGGLGKSALFAGGISAFLALNAGASPTDPEFLKNVGTSAGTGVAGNVLGGAFSSKVLGGKFGGPKGATGFGLGVGIGLADDLLLSKVAAPEGEGNQYLRTATSFLPPGLNVAGRAGIRAGEAINYKFGGGQLGEKTNLVEEQRGKFNDTYAVSTKIKENEQAIAKLNSLKKFLTPNGSAQRDNLVSGYEQQNEALRANYDQLKGNTKEDLKPLFDDLSKAIDELRSNGIPVQEPKQNESSQSFAFPPINIEISVKDVDKLPELFNSKIIEPLEAQIRSMKDRLSRAETDIGINPAPSSI